MNHSHFLLKINKFFKNSLNKRHKTVTFAHMKNKYCFFFSLFKIWLQKFIIFKKC